MSFRIDGSLYPDKQQPVPRAFPEKVDYLARLCSAWDFGVPAGNEETLRENRRAEWRGTGFSPRLPTTSCGGGTDFSSFRSSAASRPSWRTMRTSSSCK